LEETVVLEAVPPSVTSSFSNFVSPFRVNTDRFWLFRLIIDRRIPKFVKQQILRN
jgi:hypothetical protein